ncbi:MAG: ABC transporter ATP-binding protein [Candidatus Zixiibacteriota bacterium]
MAVKAGEIYTILGPNGAGKSTTINILTTLMPASSGTATILGYDINRDKKKIRRNIELMPQGPALDPFLSVIDNLKFYAKLNGSMTKHWHSRALGLLESLELADREKHSVMALSGGQFRRVQLARLLLSDAKIVFLDEPTLGVDVSGKSQIWNLLKPWCKDNNRTILLTTNDMAEAEALSDRVMFIFKGMVHKEGFPHELKKQLSVNKLTIEFNEPISSSSVLSDSEFEKIDKTTISVSVENSDHGINELLSRIDSNLSIKRINTDVMTLADVFEDLRSKS